MMLTRFLFLLLVRVQVQQQLLLLLLLQDASSIVVQGLTAEHSPPNTASSSSSSTSKSSIVQVALPSDLFVSSRREACIRTTTRVLQATGSFSLLLQQRLNPIPSVFAADDDEDDLNTATSSLSWSLQQQERQQQQEQECAQGTLTAERQIPGAYENACMYLPVRPIPIVHSLHTTTTTATTAPATTTTILHIRQQVAAAGSTGLAVWNSSLLLTRLLEYMAMNPPKNNNNNNHNNNNNNIIAKARCIVELGCGTGLVSLAAATLGAQQVYATDGNPAVVELAHDNIQRNQLQQSVKAKLLPWGGFVSSSALFEDSTSSTNDDPAYADLILGSDLTYNPGNWPALADSMEALLDPVGNGMVIYLSLGHAEFNVQAEIDGFLSVANSRGLVPIRPTDPEWPLLLRTTQGHNGADDLILLPEDWVRQTCRTKEEEQILLGNSGGGGGGGGVRILFLKKRALRRFSARQRSSEMMPNH